MKKCSMVDNDKIDDSFIHSFIHGDDDDDDVVIDDVDLL